MTRHATGTTRGLRRHGDRQPTRAVAAVRERPWRRSAGRCLCSVVEERQSVGPAELHGYRRGVGRLFQAAPVARGTHHLHRWHGRRISRAAWLDGRAGNLLRRLLSRACTCCFGRRCGRLRLSLGLRGRQRKPPRPLLRCSRARQRRVRGGGRSDRSMRRAAVQRWNGCLRPAGRAIARVDAFRSGSCERGRLATLDA